jgi:hypothetical protein
MTKKALNIVDSIENKTRTRYNLDNTLGEFAVKGHTDIHREVAESRYTQVFKTKMASYRKLVC